VRREWTCEPKERVRSKVTPSARLNVRGVPVRMSLVHTEEATFTFSKVNWEAPFHRPFFTVIEGLLDSLGSLQRVGGGRPDGEIISIE